MIRKTSAAAVVATAAVLLAGCELFEDDPREIGDRLANKLSHIMLNSVVGTPHGLVEESVCPEFQDAAYDFAELNSHSYQGIITSAPDELGPDAYGMELTFRDLHGERYTGYMTYRKGDDGEWCISGI